MEKSNKEIIKESYYKLIFEDLNDNWLLEMTNLQTWFRDKHNLFLLIDIDQTTYPKFCYKIIKYNEFSEFLDVTNTLDWYLYKSYDECLEYGLLECIDYIK